MFRTEKTKYNLASYFTSTLLTQPLSTDTLLRGFYKKNFNQAVGIAPLLAQEESGSAHFKSDQIPHCVANEPPVLVRR